MALRGARSPLARSSYLGVYAAIRLHANILESGWGRYLGWQLDHSRQQSIERDDPFEGVPKRTAPASCRLGAPASSSGRRRLLYPRTSQAAP
jgi:hypothetical protein